MKSTTPLSVITQSARTGLSGNWGKAIGIMLVYMVLMMGVTQVPFAGGLLQWIFAPPLVVGMHMFFLATVRSQYNPFSLLFDGFGRFGTSWCAYTLVQLIVTAWMIPFMLLAAGLLFFVHPDGALMPAYTVYALMAIVLLTMVAVIILIQMRYYQVLYIVADDPSVRAREAIRRSIELMSGNYWRLGLLWLRFIGWQILCVFTLGIGFIWLIPYMTSATAAFYDDLTVNGN
jgi:uncharacterized membrane protein